MILTLLFSLIDFFLCFHPSYLYTYSPFGDQSSKNLQSYTLFRLKSDFHTTPYE